MLAIPADEKLKVKLKTQRSVVERSTTFFPRGYTADRRAFGARLLLGSKMADGGEELVAENHKTEEEVELDLAKCAAQFAQYCQVDVRNEVWCPSVIEFEEYFWK